jgi:hypothetical protein
MSSGFTVPNSDVNFPYSISVGNYQNTPTEPGTIFYNSNNDRFEGYVATEREYNNSRFLPLSLDAATTSNLGGIKVGNNLSITADGTLNAVAESSTQKFQKILSISPYDNVADYTSINQCLTQFFGYDSITDTFPDGELAGLDSTDYPIPSATTRYIIHLMPGTYTETDTTINLPPFVSLVGEDRDSVFINVDSTTQINCYSNRNGGQQISNLTINLNNTQTSSTTAIQTANCSNILLNNIKFTLTNPSGYDITAISMSNGSNNTLVHIETNINSISATNNESITLLTASATTEVKIKNCDLLLSVHRGIKRFINASSSVITVQDSSMTIIETNNTSSSHRNECIFLSDSELNVKRSNLTTTGYDLLLNNDTHNNRALVINNTNTKAISTQTQITFTHYEDASQYDEILCPLTSLDFSTVFTTGDYISVSGATSTQNNQVFAITKIYSEEILGIDYSIIQVSKQDQLIDETFNDPSGCTIKSLYTININNSQLTATNNTIKVLDSNNYSFIRIANTDLNGDSVDPGNNKIVFNTRQVIRVGKQNADYASIYNAIQSINDNNAVQRYMIYLLPGEYYEQQQLIVPEYVSIIGENSKNTKILFDTNSGSYPDNVAIKLASNTSLENLTIMQNILIDSLSELILIGSNNLDVIESSATSITNLEIYNCHIEMISNPVTTINLFKFMKTTATITKTQIKATIKSTEPNSQYFRVFNNILSNLKVYDLVCDIDGLLVETSETIVFNNDRTVITCENPLVNLTTSGSSNVVNIIAKCEDTVETDITLTTISPYTNIIQGGMIRVYNGTTNYALYADYNSTLFTRNLIYEGAKFLRNNEENDYPNSFLKTLASYRISADGSGNIYNISATDNYGSAIDESENVLEGEDVGTFIMSGNKNILFGIRLGGKLTTGSRNVMMGVDCGNYNYSISDNVLIGIEAGNVITGNKHVIIGSNTAAQLKTGTRDVIIGYNSASNANNATDITVVGVNSGMQLTDASNMVLVGNDVGPQIGNSFMSVLIGTQIGNNLNVSDKSVIIGNEILNVATDIDNAVIIGSNAAANISSGSESVIIGSNAAANITTITNSVVIGKNAGAGQDNTGANETVIIGHNTGSNIGSITKSVIIGSNVGNQMSNDATMNIVLGGSDTANKLTSGSNSVIIGSYSATELTTGNRHIIMGNHSGNRLDTTDDIIILGHNSGSNISGGNDTDDKAIIIGNDAGQYMSNGGVIFIGHEAGKKATGEDSIIIGNQAGRTISGPRNLLIGNYTAGISNNPVVNPVEGRDNIIFGNRAGYSLTTGNYNFIAGSGDVSNGSAGNDLTTGEGNMIVGYRAGRNLVDGDYNFLFGREAGFNLNDGSRNFIMGDRSGYNLNSGGDANDCMIIGNLAGYNLTEGEGILMIGQEAGYNGTSADDSLYIGKRAGFENSTGSQTVYIGNEAGYKNTLGQSVMIGVEAGRNSTTSERNTFIGFGAGRGKGETVSENLTGDQIIAIGYEAGSNLVSGYQTILIGNNAGRNNEAGAKSIMIGPNAGQNSTASKSIFIGATDSNTGGVGFNTSGEYDIFIGVSAGENNTSGSEDIFIGSHAGNKNTTGSNSVFIGNDAGRENLTGSNSIKIGKEAGRDDTTGSDCVIIGPEAGKSANSNSVVLIGSQAGMLNTANASIFIGPEAGKNNTSGLGSIMIGAKAGLLNEEGNNCIFIGQNAGSSFRRTTDTLGENIYIGSNAGMNNVTGIRNIIMGTETFENSANGSGVIAIGYRAGRNAGLTANQEDNFNNIIIGQNAISTGDIALNNTAIGSNVARNVDNNVKFAGNTMLGADSGKNSNLAINSIILGSSGRIGTGGENNIIAGFSAGDNLGNDNSLIINTITAIETNDISVELDLPYKQGQYYFKSGDTILIKYETASFEFILGKINDNGSGKCLFIFNNYYTGSITLEIGSTVFSLANLSDNVGILDNSKSSSNTLMGTLSGNQLTTGSKSVALGSSAMYKNKKGKYNNILGTQAGYSLRSDNNTCYGTRAGYSIDEYTYTNNTVLSNLTFISNTNSIESTSNLVSTGLELGSVIELNGTTNNNERFIVKTSNADVITVYGFPEINKSGVSQNIKETYIQHEQPTFNFVNKSFSGNGLQVKTYDDTVNLYYITLASGVTDTSNIAKLTDIDNGGVIKISGSSFNDGIYYVDARRLIRATSFGSTFYNTYNAYPVNFSSHLFPELFSSNVNISINSINSFLSITSQYSYDDAVYFAKFLNGSYMNTYFGINKNRNLIDYNNKGFLNNPDYNHSIYLNSELNNELAIPENIFTEGYIQRPFSKVRNAKHDIFGEITFDSGNNTITFSNTNDLFDIAEEGYFTSFFKITGTSNNNIKFRISNIDGNVITVDSAYELTNEIINANTNVVSFINNEIVLDEDLNDYELSDNYIVNISLRDDYDNTSTPFDKVVLGSYLIDRSQEYTLDLTSTYVTSSLSFADNTLLPTPLSTNSGELIINRDIYKVDNYYKTSENKLAAYDYIFQSGNIETYSSNFTLFSSNSVIYADTKYQFTDIVAPVMIKVNNNYHLVKRNCYPFQHLELDSVNTPILTDTTTSIIEFNSISIYQDSSNLASVFDTSGTEYKVFNNNTDANHGKIISAVSNSSAIMPQSVYLTEESNITTKNSNNRLISMNNEVSGYFKNITVNASDVEVDFMNGGTLNIVLTFYSDEIVDYFTASGTANIAANDIIKISGTSNSTIDNYFEIISFLGGNIGSSIGSQRTIELGLDSSMAGKPSFTLSNASLTFKINTFRTTTANFSDMKNYYGELSNFIRISQQEVLGYDNDAVIYYNIYSNSLNYTVGGAQNANLSTSSLSLAFVESVPSDNEFIVDKYGFFLGTPVLDNINETENIKKPPIGYIDIIQELPYNIYSYDSDTMTYSFENLDYPYDYILNTTQNFSSNSFNDNVKGVLSIHTSNNHLVISDLSFDTANINASDNFQLNENNKGCYLTDKINNPFKEIKPGMTIDIYTPHTSNTYIVKNKVNEYIIEIEDRTASNVSISDYSYNFNYNNQLIISKNVTSNLMVRTNGVSYDSGINSYLFSDRYNFREIDTSLSTEPLSIFNLDQNIRFDGVDVSAIKIETTEIELPDEILGIEFNSILKLSNVNTIDISRGTQHFYSRDNLDYGPHTLIIPNSNLSLIDVNELSFNSTILSGLTINLDKLSSNSTIEIISGGTTTGLQVGNIIKYTRNSDIIGYYKISELTSTLITIDTTYNNLNTTISGDSNITIETNTINSSNISIVDLSIYKAGEKLIISKTINNNGIYIISNNTPTTADSIYIENSLTTEEPVFCLIEKSVIIDEESEFTYTANLDSITESISLTGSNSNTLVEFVPEQQLIISGATESANNGKFTVSDTLPTNTLMYIPIVNSETNSLITINKSITLTEIGASVNTVLNSGAVKRFHYLDSQGNNLMLGSFAGHYSGANSLSTHNIYIGSKVGQTNHGSGNIFFGNETLFAENKDEGSTTYNNKFAVYKNNFIGIPANPLIGGDFGSGRVGINTINPDNYAIYSSITETDSKLIINGSVIANAYTPFTGAHIISIDNSVNVKPGMCMISSGKVIKKSLLNTIVSCEPSTKANDKRIYGIYSHYEIVNGIKQHYVASVGEGMILVCNIAGEPENGDYVSTSPISGLTQLQNDDLLHNYTVAKITEYINWDSDFNTINYNGQKYKYKLVSCTYHCG